MTNLFEVKNLKKYFPVYKGLFKRHVGDVKAIDGVSFEVRENEIVGIVGESGSGKSTIALTATWLYPPSEGEIFLCGKNLRTYAREKMALRRQIQVIFQDPLSSLSPRKTVLENMGEALLYHGIVKDKEEQKVYVLELLAKVGLGADALYKFPHQFSGGQQQRISIGRAIALKPKLLICDEILSALDLSIQGHILNLLYALKEQLALSYLFISHDLGCVRKFCDRVLVMHKGKIVERGPVQEIFENPQHDYTKLLLASILKTHPVRYYIGSQVAF